MGKVEMVEIGKYFIDLKINWFKTCLAYFCKFRKFRKNDNYDILLKTFWKIYHENFNIAYFWKQFIVTVH